MSETLTGYRSRSIAALARYPGIGTLLFAGVARSQRAVVADKVSKLVAAREAGVVTQSQFQRQWSHLFPDAP